MAVIIQQPDAVSFSSTMNEVVFSSTCDHAVVTVVLEYASAADTVFGETLYPDADGLISLTSLAEMLEPYLRARLNVRMTATISEYEAADSATPSATLSTTPCTVLFAMVDVGEDAATFTNSHFLTTLNGNKMTAAGLEERVYAYNAATVTLTAAYLQADGSLVYLETTVNPAGVTDDIYAFFVGPDIVTALFPNAVGELIQYTVTAGLRQQRFDMVSRPMAPAPSLAFINSFGCIEFLHCFGTHKKDSNYTRSSARIRGRLRNYKIVEERVFHAETGWLNTAMADWADELFRSQEVYLWLDGEPGRQVVVSESKSTVTNEDDDMPSFEFSYVYAQRIHNVMQRTHAGRIFDNTFDHTFN